MAVMMMAGKPHEGGTLLDAQPHKTLSPPDVIRLQLTALAHNQMLGKDQGIDVAWRFASPSNRAATGPYNRFREMVRGGYPAMLDHRKSALGELELTAIEARQLVVLEAADGSVHAYLWVLGLQDSGPYRGCWMTDAVIELPTAPRQSPPPDTDKRDSAV